MHNLWYQSIYKNKCFELKIRNETEREIEQRKSKTRKDSSPSPTSYDCASGVKKTDRFHSSILFKLGKEKKELYVEKACNSKKAIPGVGKYNSHLALDKVYRPTMKSKMN